MIFLKKKSMLPILLDNESSDDLIRLLNIFSPMEEEQKKQQEGTPSQEIKRMLISSLPALLTFASAIMMASILGVRMPEESNHSSTLNTLSSVTGGLIIPTVYLLLHTTSYTVGSLINTRMDSSNKPWKFEDFSRKASTISLSTAGLLFINFAIQALIFASHDKSKHQTIDYVAGFFMLSFGLAMLSPFFTRQQKLIHQISSP